MSPPLVHIHYLRPPDRRETFRQLLVCDADDVKVTLATDLTLDRPLRIDGRVALEAGSPAVWFTFPGAWHDIGRFHRADGTFTGTYANILTPPVLGPDHVWHTTDLFLDLWIDPSGSLQVLDREQFEDAVDRGWLRNDQVVGARAEVDRLVQAWERGEWPPPVVADWTLERARAAAGTA